MSKILAFLQQLVTADKTAIASALVGLLTVLAAKFGFRLNGSDTAYLAAGVMSALGVFTHAHFAAKKPQPGVVTVVSGPQPAGEHEKPQA